MLNLLLRKEIKEMCIYMILIFVCILYKLKLTKNISYLSVQNTTCINGIFILLVFYRHLIQYINFSSQWDYPMNILDAKLLQFIVVTFLFYSGFGIYESIKKNRNYVNNMPKKRILKVWMQFVLAVFLFLIVGLIFKSNFKIQQVLLSFIGWKSLGNSNWYIFYILISYIFVYLAFSAVNDEKKDGLSLILISIMSILYIFLLQEVKPSWWYNTALCFPLGMWFSYFKIEIDNLLLNNNRLWFLTLIICLVIIYITYKLKSNIWAYELCAIFIVLFIVFMTMRVLINNKILYWLGKNLFGLYILQRIPMIILNKMNIISNPYYFMIICFVSMIIMGALFNMVFNKLYMRILNYEKIE